MIYGRIKLEFYDKLIDTNPDFERKGKTMPYTSVNGHVFSQLNKAGDSVSDFQKKMGNNLRKNIRQLYLSHMGL